MNNNQVNFKTITIKFLRDYTKQHYVFLTYNIQKASPDFLRWETIVLLTLCP